MFILEIIANKIFGLSVLKYYDVRKQCEGSLCYDFSNMENFLNQKSVRKALGVGDIEFVSCSTAVYEAMQMDWMRNLEVGIPALLQDGIKLLVYAGEYDLICNWLGTFPRYIQVYADHSYISGKLFKLRLIEYFFLRI